MPFTDQLHYFYLYLKQHIETQHQVICERADDRVRTIPILDKIIESIMTADFVIADCSGRNPNVFYELGLAHAYDKPVVLITGDSMSEVPSDVRHFEFIPYKLSNHLEFLNKLDNAITHLTSGRYRPIYDMAISLWNQFVADTSVNARIITFEAFLPQIKDTERRGPLPAPEHTRGFAEFALPHIIEDQTNLQLMVGIADWSKTVS